MISNNIIKEVAMRFKCCPNCHRPHRIVHELYVPKEFKDKYQPLPCHLKFLHYVGSYEDQGFTYDVFDYPISWNRYYEGFEDLKEEEPEDFVRKYLEFVYFADE